VAAQTAPGLARESVGKAILHPAAVAGTKAAVVGLAWIRDPDAACAPRETGSALVHVKVVVSRLPSAFTPMTRNVADAGTLKHASGVVKSPRSNDQYPPGVLG